MLKKSTNENSRFYEGIHKYYHIFILLIRVVGYIFNLILGTKIK